MLTRVAGAVDVSRGAPAEARDGRMPIEGAAAPVRSEDDDRSAAATRRTG